MSENPKQHSKLELDDRMSEVLKSVIREHVVSGEPIGSKRVASGTCLDLSPATIRNVMAELEDRGLLAQPHTSAGRVPTDRAYRLYVDQMVRPPRMPATQAQAIDEALDRSRGEFAELLSETSRQLSRFSNQVGLVMAPELSQIIVEHMEFVRLDGHRVVAIVVARSGAVHNRILEVEESLDQSELDRCGRYLSTEFSGRTLAEMRDLLRASLSEERAEYDRLMSRSLDLGSRVVEAETESAATEVFVGGASNLLESPEFADPEVARRLFRALEEKRALIGLLSRVMGGHEVRVTIGEENEVADLSRCSVVTSQYRAGDRILGTLGIVGPTRMEYARAIALVGHLAQLLTRLLSGAGN